MLILEREEKRIRWPHFQITDVHRDAAFLFSLAGERFWWDRSNPTACAGNGGLVKNIGLHVF